MRAELVEALDAATRLATSQYGVVSRAQLYAVGVDRSAIEHRLGTGSLHRLHHGVYAVGHRSLTVRGHWLAAVLAAGHGAVLAIAAAAAAWDMRSSSAALIDVLVPTAGGRARHQGLRIHRRPDLHPDETTHLGPIPITTPARTLFDLAARLPQPALERALERAEAQRIIDHAELAALLTRRPSHPGARKLAAVQIDDEPHLTRSVLEDRFLELLARHCLPKPLVNHRVLDYEVDFLWPVHRLIVEADSLRYHGTPVAFERDRRRDIHVKLAGYDVARLTDRDIISNTDETATTIRALLLRCGS